MSQWIAFPVHQSVRRTSFYEGNRQEASLGIKQQAFPLTDLSVILEKTIMNPYLYACMYSRIHTLKHTQFLYMDNFGSLLLGLCSFCKTMHVTFPKIIFGIVFIRKIQSCAGKPRDTTAGRAGLRKAAGHERAYTALQWDACNFNSTFDK